MKHLLAIWVKGWTVVRGTPPPVAEHGGWRVDVGWPGQRLRYVFAHCPPGLHALAASISASDVHLKAACSGAQLLAALPPPWVLEQPRFFMACEGPMRAAQALAPGYRMESTNLDARILAPDGSIACSGGLALVEGYAIYDRIATAAAHQRRGLAHALMLRLQALAAARGAHQGLLVATAEGRALYTALGWRELSPYSTAMRPA